MKGKEEKETKVGKVQKVKYKLKILILANLTKRFMLLCITSMLKYDKSMKNLQLF
jgi:hypothetical protein